MTGRRRRGAYDGKTCAFGSSAFPAGVGCAWRKASKVGFLAAVFWTASRSHNSRGLASLESERLVYQYVLQLRVAACNET